MKKGDQPSYLSSSAQSSSEQFKFWLRHKVCTCGSHRGVLSDGIGEKSHRTQELDEYTQHSRAMPLYIQKGDIRLYP